MERMGYEQTWPVSKESPVSHHWVEEIRRCSKNEVAHADVEDGGASRDKLEQASVQL